MVSRSITPLAALFFLLCAPALHASFDAVAVAKEDRRLGFTVSGRVEQVNVVPGQRVEAAQPLLSLDARASEARVDLTRITAESDLAIQLAEAEWKLASSLEARVRDAHGRDAADDTELEDAVLETRRQLLRLQLARQQQAQALQQLAIARLQHEQYMILAPVAGVIEEVDVAPGELVDELQGVIRLVDIDTLVIDVSVPIRDTLALRTGGNASVSFSLLPDAQPVVGRITQLSAIGDTGSGTRRVRVEAPNPHGLPGGCIVEVSFPETTSNARSLWGRGVGVPLLLLSAMGLSLGLTGRRSRGW